MTGQHLGDRMPDVARGAAGWSPVEASHLATCAECAAEWRVVELAAARSRLPALDLDRITAAVIAGTRPDGAVIPFRPRRSWRGWAVGLAAAASVLLAVAIWQRGTAEGDVAAVPAREATLLPELDGLLEGELQVILASYEQDEAAEQPLGSVPRLGDLTEAELERLMEEVEG